MKLLIDSITLRPDEKEELLPRKAMRLLKLRGEPETVIIRKSLDARKKQNIHYTYRLMVSLSLEEGKRCLAIPGVSMYREPEAPAVIHAPEGLRATVLGSGPAGLFCALRLIEAGVTVDIFERGKPVEERMKDITLLETEGQLNRESNVLFGEGGAGTYSDGKLTARTRRPESHWLFRMLVDMGAPSEILYQAKPHLGSDRLVSILKNIRQHIVSRGSHIHYNHRVDDIIIRDSHVAGVKTSQGNEFPCDALFLAQGHSARDTYEMLHAKSVLMEPKPFALGVRVEHPRELIDRIQYGPSPFTENLPSAEYMMTHNNKKTGRGAYTFCMCPGGRIINSSSENDKLCLNGMSYASRSLPFSNAGVVVTVRPDDFGPGPLGGIAFQRSIEERASLCVKGVFQAPAQRITSFIKNIADSSLPESSFAAGIQAVPIDKIFPSWITSELKEALLSFNKKMKGFITEHGLMLAPETRTSSPVRIVRSADFQSVTHRGLYPVGEGAGHAGGIVSSAVDGIRAADSFCQAKKMGSTFSTPQ